MNKSAIPATFSSILKIFIFTGFVLIGNNIFSQSTVTPLPQSSLTQLMDENKFKGLPVYSGINSEFVVTTKNEMVSTKDSLSILQNLTQIKNYVSCDFKPTKHLLIVKTKKEANENMIKNIKEKIVPFNILISDYQETIYKATN